MRRSALLAALTLVIRGCSDENPVPAELLPKSSAAISTPRQGPPSDWIAEWTLLVYAANDDLDPNLVQAFDQDALEWQRGLGGSALFRIVVQRDYAPFQLDDSGNPRPSERYALYREERRSPDDNQSEAKTLGETDTTNPDTLRDFLVTSIRAFPARHYWVTITGHGDGWNGLADDATTGEGRRMDLNGLRGALAEASSVIANEIRPRDGLGGLGTSDRLDVVAFDVCRLGAVEAASTLSGVADFMIASQEAVPDSGHPYSALRYIAQDRPGSSPRDLVEAVVTDYVRAYVDGVSTAARSYVGTNITSLGVDLRRMGPLEEALRDVVASVRRERPKGFSCAEVSALVADACGKSNLPAAKSKRGSRSRTVASEASVDLVALLERLADPARCGPSAAVSPTVNLDVAAAARKALDVIGRPHFATPMEPWGVQLQYGGQYRQITTYELRGPFVVEAQRVDPGTGARLGGLSVLFNDPYDLLFREGGTTALDAYRALPFTTRTGWLGILEACVEKAEACRAYVPNLGSNEKNPCDDP